MSSVSLKSHSQDCNISFPYGEELNVLGEKFNYQKILQHLDQWVSVERKQKIENVLKHRTYNLVTVLEDIYDYGNIGAVIRTQESFGFQAMHVIHSEKVNQSRNVTIGSDKWLDYFSWNTVDQAISRLKEANYQIVATTLSEKSVPLYDIDFTRPTALILGNEKDGVSQRACELADIHCKIPMHGFSQSFNISVAAALCLQTASRQRIQKFDNNGDLSPKQSDILKAVYYLKSMKDKLALETLKRN